MSRKDKSKTEEDLSQPTAEDLSSPAEIKTLEWDNEKHEVRPVFIGAAVAMPPPVVPPPALETAANSYISRDLVLAIVDELCTRCGSGWTLQLADLREVKAKIAKLG